MSSFCGARLRQIYIDTQAMKTGSAAATFCNVAVYGAVTKGCGKCPRTDPTCFRFCLCLRGLETGASSSSCMFLNDRILFLKSLS